MLLFVLKGIVIGLTVAIPVGPVGLLCLDMTVTHGRKAGMSCALGMIAADVISASIMLLSISALYTFINDHAFVIKVSTGLFFSCLGIGMYLTRNRKPKRINNASLAGLSMTSFLLSLTPATFALMIFLFPALGLIYDNSVPPILIGTALGSAAWCGTILCAGNIIRRLLGDKIGKFKGGVGILFILMGLGAVMLAIYQNYFG